MPNGTYGGVRGRKTKVGRKLLRFPPTRLFAQHEHILTGASPQAALMVGRLQPKARVSIVRWNLKEAIGKHLTRRTET